MRGGIFLVACCAAVLLAACGGEGGSAPPAAGLARSVQGGMAPDGTAQAYSIAGYRGNYVIANNGGTVTVTSKIDAADVVTFHDPKLIKFVDKWTSFDIAGGAGQVYRLYQAAFNRKPDQVGLGFWIKASEGGFSLTDIAGGFLGSDEFKKLYGDNASPSAFVDAMYQNVLHRPGEPGGYDWWVKQVSNGVDRRAVLIGFADGDENRSALMPDMVNGFDFVPYDKGGPLLPKPSSYENKVAAAQVLGQQWLPPETAYANAVAFGDFFQDGRYAMVSHTLEYIPKWDQSQLGHIRFYRQDGAGNWVDSTSTILKDTTGCLHPRKAVVADFNGDGKPDVFFACHGYDREPYPGERQRLLLSGADGSYRNILLDTKCFCHGASAFDASGNGFADIVVTDTMVQRVPFFLMNNRDGTFREDTGRLPADLKFKAIFSIEAIDFDKRGRYDIWIGGNEPGATADATTTDYDTVPLILRNDGAQNYPSALVRQLPAVPDYGLPLDIVVNNGKIYLLRTNIGGGPNNYGLSFYTTAAIQTIDYKTGESALVYTHKGPYGNGMQWVNWLIPVADKVKSMDAVYGIETR